MKTDGQILYELQHPTRIRVVSVNDHFRQHPFEVDNPVHVVPYNLLTERCRQSWERYAVDHNLVLSYKQRADERGAA